MRGRNLKDDPDLTNFAHLLIPTNVGGLNRADAPRGPSQSKKADDDVDDADNVNKAAAAPAADWGGLDPQPRSVMDEVAAAEEQENLDGEIAWDDADGHEAGIDGEGQ